MAGDYGEGLANVILPLIFTAIFGGAGGLMYYFGSSLMGGENGYYAKQRTTAELENKQAELETLRATRQALDKKVALLSPGNLDRDLLDEQARAVLGLADKSELVIILEGKRGSNRQNAPKPSAE